MKKIQVVDTNVFLSSPEALAELSKKYDVVIPFKVLEELDNNKKRTGLVGVNARRFIRILDELRKLGSLHKGVSLKGNKGRIFVELQMAKHMMPQAMEENSADNQIVSAAMAVKQKFPNKRVVFISNDINLRVKCDVLEIECEEYIENSVKLENVSESYDGFKLISVADKVVDDFYSGKEIYIKKHKVFPNQHIMLQSETDEKKTALARFISKEEPLVKIIPSKKENYWGLTPRNKEQLFALDLILNPDISLVTLTGTAGTGKAQPLDSKVYTPSGFKYMGDLKSGDEVLTPRGKKAKILKVFPQGEKDIYKVTFSDNSSTECCKDHLWLTQTCLDRDAKRAGSVKSLEEIKQQIHTKNNKRNHSIPMVSNLEFDNREQKLDPYLLGALLGDGGFSQDSVNFSSEDKEIVDNISNILNEYNMIAKFKDNYDYRLIHRKRRNWKEGNYIIRSLKFYGLMGKTSESKFIPDEYKFSSMANRISILQGLLDTDGTVCKRDGSVSYTSVSKKLAEDMKFLVMSLGGKASIKSRYTYYTYLGEKRRGKLSYRMSITLPNEIKPFRLSRKQILVKEKVKYFPTRYIDSVEYVGKKPAQCILIDDEEHLYITDDFIVTHNTLAAIAGALEMVFTEQKYDKILIIRPIVTVGKDIGYLPGSKEEKIEPFISPVIDNLNFLFGGRDNLQDYLKKGLIEIEAMSFVRGRSLANAVIIFDEAQNINHLEAKTILTRVGENTKIIMIGDTQQIDNVHVNDVSNGLTKTVETFKEYDISGHVTLKKGERSKLATLAAKVM